MLSIKQTAMFKKNNEKKIGQNLKAILGRKELSSGYNQVRVKKWWEETMGELVKSQTKRVTFSDGVLRLNVESASLKSELNMSRHQLKEQINQHFGEELVGKVEVY